MGVGAPEPLALAGGAANRGLRFAVRVILGVHLLNRFATLRALHSILPSPLWINLHRSAVVLLVSLQSLASVGSNRGYSLPHRSSPGPRPTPPPFHRSPILKWNDLLSQWMQG